MENSKPKHNNARFMQPILPTFLGSFSIPVAFVRRLEDELKVDQLKSVMLKTEEEPHLFWKVEMEGGCHFKDGWKEFCDSHGLKVGDFVVFEYQLNSNFQVSVFDPPTSCQRLSGSKTKRSGLKSNAGESSKNKTRPKISKVEGKSSVEGQCLASHIITLTSFAFNKSIVYLSRHFTRSSGLANRRCEIKLIDEKGRHWKVQLLYRKCDGQSYIRGGWIPFQAANNFRPGDVISFQLLENSGKCPIMKCHRIKRRHKS